MPPNRTVSIEYRPITKNATNFCNVATLFTTNFWKEHIFYNELLWNWQNILFSKSSVVHLSHFGFHRISSVYTTAFNVIYPLHVSSLWRSTSMANFPFFAMSSSYVPSSAMPPFSK